MIIVTATRAIVSPWKKNNQLEHNYTVTTIIITVIININITIITSGHHNTWNDSDKI